MAEGLLRQLAGDRFDVFSAGIEAGSLRAEAVAAMKEIGVDISTQRAKSVDEYAGQPFDVVVTTCEEAKEACPLFPGRPAVTALERPGSRRRRWVTLDIAPSPFGQRETCCARRFKRSCRPAR